MSENSQTDSSKVQQEWEEICDLLRGKILAALKETGIEKKSGGEMCNYIRALWETASLEVLARTLDAQIQRKINECEKTSW